MKTEDLQQYIIILLCGYLLFNLFYKCECTRKTLENMMPDVDVDVNIGDIASGSGGSGGSNDSEGSGGSGGSGGSDSENPDYSGSGGEGDPLVKFMKNLGENLTKIMTDVQVLAVIGSIGAIIVIGVLVVRFRRGTEKAVSTAVGESSSIINEAPSKKEGFKNLAKTFKSGLLSKVKKSTPVPAPPPNAV
jgi:hypothetical protein